MKRGLHVIAIYELVKGAFVLIVGLGLLTFIHKDLQAFGESLILLMHFNPAHHYPRIFLDFISRFSDMNFMLLAAGAFFYSMIRFIEAYGLWYERKWAEWMAILSGAMYLPIEIYEMTKLINWPRVLITAGNFAIVIYLIQIKFWRQSYHGPDSRDSGSVE
jgi:uncharacterized membrane protein (DUF2068 family)